MKLNDEVTLAVVSLQLLLLLAEQLRRKDGSRCGGTD